MASGSSPAFFIVACIGHSGSAWLAEMLNRHPDIVCSHAYEPPPFSIPGDPIAQVANEASTPERVQERLDNAASRVVSLPLDTLFEELSCYAEARAYGNVHMHTLRSLQASADKYPPTAPIKVANLIRHPVSWVDSRAGNFHARMTRSSAWAAREIHQALVHYKDELVPLIKDYGLDVNDSKIAAFLAAAAQVGVLIADILAWPDVWFVKMETITSDPDYFAQFVHEITSGAVITDAAYIEAVFAIGKRNMHSANSGLRLDERYECWTEWQKRAYVTMSQKFHLPEIYGKFGYDFSFVA